MNPAIIGYIFGQTLIGLIVAMIVVLIGKKAKRLEITYFIAMLLVIGIAALSVNGGGSLGIVIFPILINAGILYWSYKRTLKARK